MGVTIQNASKRRQVFVLAAVPLQTAGGEHGYRIVRAVVVEQTKKGKLRGVVKPRLVPSSLTFLAGEMKTGLPHSVLKAPAIVKGLRKGGELRLVAQDPEDPPPPTPETKNTTAAPAAEGAN